MTSVNIFALSIMGVLILLDLAFIFYVLPKNWRETQRTRNEYTPLRWVIFNVTLSMVAFSLIPLAYQLTRLDVPTQSIEPFRALSSMSWVLFILSFMIGWLAIHAVSDILIRKDKDKRN